VAKPVASHLLWKCGEQNEFATVKNPEDFREWRFEFREMMDGQAANDAIERSI
jgi:hypothetical protein